MASKINLIRNHILADGILLTTWLEKGDVTRSELSDYVKHGTLERVAWGVYKYPGTTQSLYGILSSYQTQSKLDYHIGASTALEINGYNHYLPMGKPKAIIFTPRNAKLPKWFLSNKLDMTIKEVSTAVFGDFGIETIDYEGYTLRVSSPERAIMECILLSPQQYDIMGINYLMEMLNSMRTSLVQKLLESCTSVKVKRLFLYLAEKAGHRWFSKLNLNNISLGFGTRSFVTGGVKNTKYDIMIPHELNNYEGNI